MEYKKVVKGKFLSRPNRFIAMVDIEGREEVCHVKNTGRCKELLAKGTTVYLYVVDNPDRKTKYDLIAVEKGNRLINMDSQVVNGVFGEFIPKLFKDIIFVKPETKYKNSRFDFYIETKNEKIFAEVKGVTLEKDGVVMFPDTPTERGVKHLNELMACMEEGYTAYVVFVIQMNDVKYFTPNIETHKVFAETLKIAKEKGVNVIAIDCNVTPETITASDCVEVRL